MKIERSNANSWRLSVIKDGEVFEYANDVWLKTDEVVDDRRTCIRLADGHVDWFVEELFVYKRVAKVVVE